MPEKKKIVVLANCQGLEIQRYLRSSQSVSSRYNVVYLANFTNMDDPLAAEYVYTELLDADVLISQNVQHIEWLRNENLAKRLKKGCDFIRLVFWRFDGYWPIELPRNSESFWYLPVENNAEKFSDYIGEPLSRQLITEKFEREMEKLRTIDASSDFPMFDFFEQNHQQYQIFSDHWHPTAIFFLHLMQRIIARLECNDDISLLRNDCVNRDRYRFIFDAVRDEVGLTYDQTFLNFHDIVVTRQVFFDFSREVAPALKGTSTNDAWEAFSKWKDHTGRPTRLVSVAQSGKTTQSSSSVWSTPDESRLAITGNPTGRFAFHTDKEPRPWWKLSFDGILEISALTVWNRGDGDATLKKRALPFEVQHASDDEHWKKVATVHYRFGGLDEDGPLEMRFGEPLVLQNLRLQVGRNSILHLDQVDVRVKAVTTNPHCL